MNETKRKGTSIQSVQRASRILLAIAGEQAGLTAQQVSVRFGLTLSTAYHLLSTLADERLLAKVEGRHYVLGPASGEIANAVARELRPPAEFVAALQRLADKTRETVFLTGWHLGALRIVETIEGAQSVRVAGLEVGFTGGIHARASSKLLLAFAEPNLREQVLEGYEFTKITTQTITTREEFDRELALIKKEGVARDRGEFDAGVYSVSAPIFLNGSVSDALAVSAPIGRFYEHEAEIVSALRAETDGLMRPAR
jgi:IclR family acetate operon transcriptional repressor